MRATRSMTKKRSHYESMRRDIGTIRNRVFALSGGLDNAFYRISEVSKNSKDHLTHDEWSELIAMTDQAANNVSWMQHYLRITLANLHEKKCFS